MEVVRGFPDIPHPQRLTYIGMCPSENSQTEE